MKKIILFTLPFLFFLQYAFAQLLLPSSEANDVCNEEHAADSEAQKNSRETVIYQSTIFTACLAATTVAALPMTRNFLGTNFSTQTLKSPIAVYASVSTPPHQEDLDFSTTKNINSNPQLLLASSFEVKVINDGIKLVSQADDFQLEHRTYLDYDFFKHRFSRFLS